MKTFPDNSVDSVVTDPPYGLTTVDRFSAPDSGENWNVKSGVFHRSSKGFMGKEWDGSGIEYNVDMWREVLRVLKPGGHLLSFGGTRTYHRMACAIEDAGFEIRDMVEWLYGSGFPKSLDIGKALDKQQGNKREVIGRNPNSRENATKENTLYESGTVGKTDYISRGNSEWEGWGTALKPAHEPICMARKPLSENTVAENVLKHGTGGLNIDASRVPTNWDERSESWKKSGYGKNPNTSMFGSGGTGIDTSKGRFPANLILSVKENEYELKNVSVEQRKQVMKWLYENI